MVIVGQGTMFPGARGVSLTQITDDQSQTIAVVETSQTGVSWLKPQDLSASKMAYEINTREDTDPGSYHSGGAHVLTADGSVLFLPEQNFSPDYLNAMTTINGGEVLPVNVLDVR
jgi:prepilin-type processing-associated H-X9-DG protein